MAKNGKPGRPSFCFGAKRQKDNYRSTQDTRDSCLLFSQSTTKSKESKTKLWLRRCAIPNETTVISESLLIIKSFRTFRILWPKNHEISFLLSSWDVLSKEIFTNKRQKMGHKTITVKGVKMNKEMSLFFVNIPHLITNRIKKCWNRSTHAMIETGVTMIWCFVMIGGFLCFHMLYSFSPSNWSFITTYPISIRVAGFSEN